MAIVPRRTMSGASLPVRNVTAGSAIVAGDLIKQQSDGDWDAAAEDPFLMATHNDFGVAMSSCASGEDFTLCKLSDDVICEVDSPHKDPADMTNTPPYQLDVNTDGTSDMSDVTCAAEDQVGAYPVDIGNGTDGTDATMFVRIVKRARS